MRKVFNRLLVKLYVASIDPSKLVSYVETLHSTPQISCPLIAYACLFY